MIKFISLPVVCCFLLISLVSCTDNTPTSNYTPVSELPEIEASPPITNIASENNTFTNTVSNSPVTVLHHLDKTGFHFYNAVAFKSKKEGMMVGGTGLRIRTTTDGGLHWQENSSSRFSNPFHSLAFSGNNVFVVGENEYIYRSSDFGENWEVFGTDALIGVEEHSVYSPKYYKIKFFNNTLGFVIGDYKGKAVMLKTLNAGESWEKLALKGLLDNERGIADFKILTEKVILMVTSSGRCYKSTDGGNNWTLIYEDKSKSLNSIAFNDENNGYIGGGGGALLHTKDGGKTWGEISFAAKQSTLNISNIEYLDNSTIVITTAFSFDNEERDFLYQINTDTDAAEIMLSKDDSTVEFVGDSYGLYRLDDTLFVLDRNNLYQMDLK